MQELKIYRCEICGTTYNTKYKCQECERGHRKPREMKPAKYLPMSQDATGYPIHIDVTMDNGKKVRYERRKEVN